MIKKMILGALCLAVVGTTVHGMDKLKKNKEKQQTPVDLNIIKSMHEVERMKQEKLNFRNRQRKITDESNQETKVLDKK